LLVTHLYLRAKECTSAPLEARGLVESEPAAFFRLTVVIGLCDERRTMPLGTLDDQLQALIRSFVDDVSRLVKSSAVETVARALGGNGVQARRGRLPRAAVGLTPQSSRRKGQKRDPKLIAATTDKLHSAISGKPGQRIEEIGKALGMSTKELALPIKKLLDGKRIRKSGQKRATQYFPR